MAPRRISCSWTCYIALEAFLTEILADTWFEYGNSSWLMVYWHHQKCVVGKVPLFLFFLSFFPSVFVFNNDISKTVQVLTVILAQALIGCVRFY